MVALNGMFLFGNGLFLMLSLVKPVFCSAAPQAPISGPSLELPGDAEQQKPHPGPSQAEAQDPAALPAERRDFLEKHQ